MLRVGLSRGSCVPIGASTHRDAAACRFAGTVSVRRAQDLTGCTRVDEVVCHARRHCIIIPPSVLTILVPSVDTLRVNTAIVPRAALLIRSRRRAPLILDHALPPHVGGFGVQRRLGRLGFRTYRRRRTHHRVPGMPRLFRWTATVLTNQRLTHALGPACRKAHLHPAPLHRHSHQHPLGSCRT